jgi:hypothetical protein
VTPWGAVQMAAWDWRANFFPVGIAHSISRQPAELAALLIRGGHARPARLDEMPRDE